MLLHFRPLLGGTKITPIKIADAQKNSVYWQATEQQTPYMAMFFLKGSDPHLLKDAPDGPAKYLTESDEQVERGKAVFADRCARCHSSKMPDMVDSLHLENCNGKDYLPCFDSFWKMTKTQPFKEEMLRIVRQPDFLKENYLSNELRVEAARRYVEALRRITGDDFVPETRPPMPRIVAALASLPTS